MRRIIPALILVIAIVSLTACAAFAQITEGDKVKHFCVGFGLYRPVDDNLRGGQVTSPIGASSNWMDLKFCYATKMDAEGRPDTYLALDWISPANDMSQLRMTPITLNKILRPKGNKFSKLYATFGAGIYPLKLKTPNLGGDPLKNFTATKPGFTVGGGVEFSTESRLELTYTWVQGFDDTWRYTVGSSSKVFRYGYSFSGFLLTYNAAAF
jgi:hypothetical protein